MQVRPKEAIKRKSRIVPFGYMVDPLDDALLLPIEKELNALEKAREYLKTCSYRQTSEWVTAYTGRYCSHVLLQRLIEGVTPKTKRPRRYKRRSKKLHQPNKHGLSTTSQA